MLLDGLDTVLPTYPEPLRRPRAARPRALWASSSASAPGSSASTKPGSLENRRRVETGRIEARTKIWAAGVQGSPLGRFSPTERRGGATAPVASRCSPDCSLPGHPEVFVVGDLMA